MAYEKTVWENGNTPAINATNLNKIEDGIADAHNILLTPGNNGLSAYEVAVENGYNDTEEAWLLSLVGPQGPAGANGVDGANGLDGENGVDGENGATGPPGENGTPGENGANGVDGRTVLSGADNPGDEVGANGDFWISTNNHAIYGPKAENSWNDTGPVSLVGPAGSNGGDGENGAPGENGANGVDGAGVASGGDTGQYLTKSSNNNYETQWSTLPEIPTINVYTCKQNGAITNMNNNTLWNNINNMAFNVTNGRRYYFRFMTTFTSTVNTCGIAFRFSAPAMTTSHFKIEIQQGGAGTDMFYTNTAFGNMATRLTSASVSNINDNRLAIVEGYCNPSANGTVQLQTAPEVNNNVSVLDVGVGFMVDAG